MAHVPACAPDDMKIGLLAFLPLALLSPALDQGGAPPAAAPLPAGAAARVDDELITREEYADYLISIYGNGPLEDLIQNRLFEREARRLGVAVSEAEVDLELERFWERYQTRFRGDKLALERELLSAGFSTERYRAKMRVELAMSLLEERIILATRTVDEEGLRTRYEAEYGPGGVKTSVRHIVFLAARMRTDLRARGVPDYEIDEARLVAELRAAGEAALARVRAGESFEAVARELSHDTSVVQNGGLIGEGYRRLGEELAKAVDEAATGSLVGPLPSLMGMHVAEVTARTSTRLEDVRAELTAAMLGEPATWQERNALRARLKSEARVTLQP
jgi:parvulin-like peptidyl-prolyl isomerase